MDGSELGPACRPCVRACVVLTTSSGSCAQGFNRMAVHRNHSGDHWQSHCSWEGQAKWSFHEECKPPQCNPLDFAILLHEEEQYLMKASLFINISYRVFSVCLIAVSVTSPWYIWCLIRAKSRSYRDKSQGSERSEKTAVAWSLPAVEKQSEGTIQHQPKVT